LRDISKNLKSRKKETEKEKEAFREERKKQKTHKLQPAI